MTLAVVKAKEVPVPQWLGQGLRTDAGPEWLQERRKAAWQQIEEIGLPTVRDEEWRYLSLAKVYETDFERQTVVDTRVSKEQLKEQIQEWRLGEGPCWVFVDGVFVPELTVGGELPRGLEIKRFDEALAKPGGALEKSLGQEAGLQRHPFAALNLASFDEGLVIEVAAGVEIAAPVQLLFLSTPSDLPLLSHPRVFVSLGENSGLTLVETYAGLHTDAYFNNAVTELVLADGARLEHYKLQYEGPAAFHIGLTTALQGRDSSLTSHTITLGGAIVRNNLDVTFKGEGANASLNGLYVLDQRQQSDTHLVMDHGCPHGSSRQFYKGILDGQSKGIFNGKVIVREGAVKTDADQINKNLVLSREAEADPKPELEIYNNDVKCSHGATVGQLDERSLFYLRSRGIPEQAARHMLTLAFAQEVLERLNIPAVREDCERRVKAKFDGES